jgi:lipoprotein NlpD
MMQRAQLGGVALAVLIGLSACGSDDGDGAGTTAAETTLPQLEAAATTPPTTVATTTTVLDAYYEVQPGDSLSAIAGQFDVRLEDLVAINEITDPNLIQAGDRLLIPPPTVLLNDATTTPATTPAAAGTSAAAPSSTP